ncbi:MAG: GNAT family N-acetyltransferase [Alphaproteobacteria bacterium]|nr:MAG: GNAT family N-acetyltransferase [Alphaproteobacteria bacterium]
MRIRPATRADLEGLYQMNQREVPHVGDVTAERFGALFDLARHFPVIEAEGKVAGFLVLFDQDTDYDSLNFLWFRDRYERFLYLDRVVIADNVKRQGLGRALYRHCEEIALESQHNLLALEVNISPPNPDSMKFHDALGFKEVGIRQDKGSNKAVSMQILQYKQS